MQPVPVKDESSCNMSTGVARRAPLGRRQRAIVQHWQALGYVIVFLGFMAGMFVTCGQSVLGGFYLFLGLALLEPLVLSALSARTGRYRLGSLFSVLGALSYVIVAGAVLAMRCDATSVLTVAACTVERFAAAALLIGGAASSFGAARALWGETDEPPALGPGATQRRQRLIEAPKDRLVGSGHARPWPLQSSGLGLVFAC